LRKTHETATIAAIGADEVRGLSRSAHKSFGARDRSARVVDRAHRRIAHGPRGPLKVAQSSQLALSKHLGLCIDGSQCQDRCDGQCSDGKIHVHQTFRLSRRRSGAVVVVR
jgi:hypothetical protein